MSTQKKLQQKRQEAVKKQVADHRRHQKEAAKDMYRLTAPLALLKRGELYRHLLTAERLSVEGCMPINVMKSHVHRQAAPSPGHQL